MTHTIIKSIQRIIVKRRLIWAITSFWFLFSNLTKTCSGLTRENHLKIKKILDNSVTNSKNKENDMPVAYSNILSDESYRAKQHSSKAPDNTSNSQKAQYTTSSGTSGGATSGANTLLSNVNVDTSVGTTTISNGTSSETPTAPGKNASAFSSGDERYEISNNNKSGNAPIEPDTARIDLAKQDEGYATDTSNGAEKGQDWTLGDPSNDDKKNELENSENSGGDGSKRLTLNNGSDQHKRSKTDREEMQRKLQERRRATNGGNDESEDEDEIENKNEENVEPYKKSGPLQTNHNSSQVPYMDLNFVLHKSNIWEKVDSKEPESDTLNQNADNQGATDEEWKNF